MSKSVKTAETEEGDENILFDDGFSVVDDIEMGTGTTEGDKEKTNDDKKEEIKSNKKQDTENKPTESKKQPDKEKNKTPPKDEESKSESSKNCGDAGTLILSNDVDLGSETSTSENVKVKAEKVPEDTKDEEPNKKDTKNDSQTEEKDTSAVKKTPIRKKGASSSYVWVTNISNSVNASSLKKHFSDCGKVNTAKVVTNGKLFFGYVEFDTPKIAIECVEKMSNTTLGGKKILVSRSRPDVTKKTSSISQKKPARSEPPSAKQTEVETKKKEEEVKTEPKKTEEKKESKEKVKVEDNKKKSEDDKKVEDKSKSDEADKKKSKETDEKKKAETDKKSSKSSKEDTSKEDDLKTRMNETKKKLETLREDLDRTQIEVRNLRRRLSAEQKKSKAEELRAERYRVQLRKTTDELKEAKLQFKRDLHRCTKKHKAELEKAEFDRESFLKREEELRRRQEDLSREFKKLEEAKKSFEHLKRSRKSRSISPPMKRFRRDVPYPDVSPPPPPKLSSDVRKPLLDRPPASYYDDKKPRIYDRLGDYGDKSYPKDSNGRYRSSYTGDSSSVSKSSWSQAPSDPWKKSLTSSGPANFMKPYLERFGDSYQTQSSSSYYPPGTSDYPKHFESSRKY